MPARPWLQRDEVARLARRGVVEPQSHPASLGAQGATRFASSVARRGHCDSWDAWDIRGVIVVRCSDVAPPSPSLLLLLALARGWRRRPPPSRAARPSAHAAGRARLVEHATPTSRPAQRAGSSSAAARCRCGSRSRARSPAVATRPAPGRRRGRRRASPRPPSSRRGRPPRPGRSLVRVEVRAMAADGTTGSWDTVADWSRTGRPVAAHDVLRPGRRPRPRQRRHVVRHLRRSRRGRSG